MSQAEVHSSSNMKAVLAMIMVFVGCCANVVFLELLVSTLPSSVNIITFSQFLFITIHGFIFTTKWGTIGPKIPMRYYLAMVTMFFIIQVINNQAFTYNISMPLHMIFRAGSLVASLILGMIILKKRYKWSKYFSVGLISCGIAVCTLSSAGQMDSHPNHTGNASYDNLMWIIGICMLSFALFMTSWMGIFQEQTYQKFGKHASEALFYNHALPLPFFLLLGNDIYKNVLLFNESAPMVLPILGISVPKLWVYLVFNTLTQYVCIRSVFVLTCECSALTVTLVVTLRKFISILISIVYFNNPFTIGHWLGTACVFIGTLIFTEIIPLGKKTESEKKRQ